jgi:hypothetical protein
LFNQTASEVFKDFIVHKVGYYKENSLKSRENSSNTTLMNNGRNNLLRFSDAATRFGKIAVQPDARTWNDSSDDSSAGSGQVAQQWVGSIRILYRVCSRLVRIHSYHACSTTPSMFHWEVSNHEPLISLRGPRHSRYQSKHATLGQSTWSIMTTSYFPDATVDAVATATVQLVLHSPLEYQSAIWARINQDSHLSTDITGSFLVATASSDRRQRAQFYE